MNQAASLSIKIDDGSLNKAKLMLVGITNGYPKVASRAINRILAGVVTDSKREIAKDLNLPVGRIAKDFKKYKAAPGYFHARVESKGKPVNLASFKGTRQVKKGLSVKVKTKGRREILKHGFLYKGKSKSGKGYKTAFWRQYDGPRSMAGSKKKIPWSRLPRKYRFPLKALTGPRIQDSMAKKHRMEIITKKANARLDKSVDYEISRFLKSL